MTSQNRNLSVALILGGLFLTLILAGCGTLQVSVQVATTPTPARSNLPDYVFADSIVLEGYSLPSLEVSTSTQLPLRLYWQVTANPPYPYALGIGLRRADGTLVWNAGGQTVSWTYGRLITEHYLQFPQKVGGGDYELEVWLYDPDSGERASVRGREAGIVRVATLHLTQGDMSSPQSSPPLVIPFATSIPTATVRP